MTCRATQINDQMVCRTCHMAWDMNDPAPPTCQQGVWGASASDVQDEATLAAAAGGGRKDDAHKTRIDLVPPELVFAVADILTSGARKYEDRNWEKGMSWGRVFGALMRHMWAWWGGAGPTTKSFLFGDNDSETGRSHLWHAGCCAAFLIAYEERGVGVDDRAKSAAQPRP